LFKKIKNIGIQNLPLCKKALLYVGIYPITDHYYEPLFHPKYIRHPLSENRTLPGIDWNTDEQLKMLTNFTFSKELENLPASKVSDSSFYINNPMFGAGSTEYRYNLIRLKKPRRILEIGSGYSTLVAIMALRRNKEEDQNYQCEHICIEPYEYPWLETTGVKIVREKVEEVDLNFFSALGKNDMLFIDSSHIIRTQGDVLFEYLELLPSLSKGVIVHIHDVFSPKDYPAELVIEQVRFWNEQYLLEAFLTSNREWKIIGALNYLQKNYYENLEKTCIFLKPDRELSSFYIQKII
jgi:hypothetical protein